MKSRPHQLHLFFNALAYFTRIEAPKWVEFNAQNEQDSLAYLPWIGFLVGAYTALIFWLCSFILPVEISILLSMITSIWITGGLHEDGLADCCDGFGGGWDKEQILKIMKDSRIGSYGALGLGLALLLKYNALNNLLEVTLTIILAHSLSRFMPLLIVYKASYNGLAKSSKAQTMASTIQWQQLAVAFVPVLVCFSFLPISYLSSLLPAILITILLANYFQHWIGGYNGDCLGCCQQSTEIGIYLWLCLPWFIQ